MFRAITKHLKKFRGEKHGISNVIVAMLSLILIVLIVSNVVLWSYQMNQFDLERIQENVKIEDVKRITCSQWFTTKNEYVISIGNKNGTFTDTWTTDDACESFTEENSYIYNPSDYNLLDSTQHVSGSIADLKTDDDNYMTFRSYASQNATGTFGNTVRGSSYRTVYANYMYGSLFTSPPATVIAKSVVFYGRSPSGANVKCLIVRHNDLKIIAITNPVSVTTTAAWRTATFSSPPTLTPDTEYILMIIPDGTVRFYYIAGSTNQGHNDASNSYSSPTDPTDASHSNYQYSIYCNYDQPIEYTVEMELTGTSNTESWTSLTWKVNSLFTTDDVNVTLQLFNYQVSNYPENGDGYIFYISSSTPNIKETKMQAITTDATHFRDGAGYWKLKIKGVKETNTRFDLKVDLVELKTEVQDAYALSIIGEFAIDLVTYPISYVKAVEIQSRLRASDTSEDWFLKVYNWTSREYDEVLRITPTTDYAFYAVNLTDNWQNFVDDNGVIRIKFCDANLDAAQTTIDIDFFGVRAIVDGAQFEIKNAGATTAHIVSIWIVNSTIHKRYDANYFVNAGEEDTYIRLDIGLPEGNFTSKIITERGNIAVFTP